MSCMTHAQSVVPEDEYKKLTRVSEDIQPLGEHPFGEDISIYDGALSFTQTDISLRGDGPVLELMRQFKVEGAGEAIDRSNYAFADWDIVLPHMETLSALGWSYNQDTNTWAKVTGWMVDTTTESGNLHINPTADPNARCSYFGPPLSVLQNASGNGQEPWEPGTWWHGYHLVIPGEGSQDILANADSNTNGTYPAVTKSHWRFSCLSSTANGQPGEGFLAESPDGTKYWFDELVYRAETGMTRPLASTASLMKPKIGLIDSLFASRGDVVEKVISLLVGARTAEAAGTSDGILRQTAWLLVTKIQDRFGNTLTFNYDSNGLLTGISASDGRALTVQYVSGTHNIQTITLQPSSGAPRTWTYGYNTSNTYGTILSSVTLPDGKQWGYNLGDLDIASLAHSGGSCLNIGIPSNLNPTTGRITHPSGLTGTFIVQPIKHGRSFVFQGCEGYIDNNFDSPGSYADIPDAYYSFSIIQESLSGAGMPTRTWSYGYSPSNESWNGCTGACPTTVYTDVAQPDGSTVRHTFSNKYDYTESQLLQEDYYAGTVTGTPIRSTSYSYAPPNTSPLPNSAGLNYQPYMNFGQSSQYSPMSKRVITQEGDTYTWLAEAFDTYANVTMVKRSNSIAGQSAIEEQTSYLYDTSLWVLGLPQTVTNVTTGETEFNYGYNSLDQLQSRSHFGEFMMSYTYDSAGQLASFTDGNNHTTTLSNYYRGIPQSIGYPDTTSQTLVVDDFGQITSITDQASHTTHYGYDAMGRITEIDYPAGDSVAWYSKYFVYDYVPTAERGIAAGHWRRTTTLGSAKTITYFDAELRPVLSDVSNGNDHTTTATAYDWKGQTAFASYPVSGQPDLGNVTTGTHHTYDALGRLKQAQEDSELGLLTTTTDYPGSASVRVTDPKTKVTTTYYQVFDEPVYKDPIQVNAPAGISQSITRDLYGNPTAITQSGSYGAENDSVTKTLIYDTYHRLCRTTEPESGSTVMAYDGANNLQWSAQGLSITGNGCGQDQVAAAIQTARTYDPMNRVLTITPPSGTQSTAYSYYPQGTIKTAISGVASQMFYYNTRDLLTSQTLSIAGTNYSWGIGYNYDSYGHVNAVGYPAANGVSEGVAYNPDALGRAAQVGGYVSGITYFPNGQVAGFNYGNGASYVAQQNARQLLKNFTYGVGSSLNVSEDFTYDGDGNITNVNDLVNGQRTKAFGYDDLNRLTSATANNLYGAESYTYDALNNLRTRLTAGTTLTFNYDAANHLANVMQGATLTTSYGYDAQGNRNSLSNGGTTTRYTFDAENQLLQVPGLENYAYDAAGRRVAKTTTSGISTYYFYDQAGQLMYQYEPATATATNYIYLGTKLVSRHISHNTHITGNIDGVNTDGAGNAAVFGWACSTNLAQSINVDLYLDGPAGSGTMIGRYLANQTSEPAVASSCGVTSGSYRFAIPLSTTTRSQYAGSLIYIHGISPTGGANSLISNSGTFTVPANAGTPTAPSSMTATVAANLASITATWPSDSSATSYLVRYALNSGSWTQSSSLSTATFTQSSPADGSYQFQVRSCNANGCSVWGASATATVQHVTAAPALSTPSANNSGSYAVSWTIVSAATSYNLQQQVNGGSWTAIQSSNATSWNASGQGNGTYAYRAQGCNGGGCGPWSNIGTAVVTHPPASAPSASVPGTSSTGSYTVSWTAVATATSYTLQEQLNGSGWTTVQANGATGWGASGRGNGTYGYRVQACNVGGCGPWSGTVSVVVTLPPASAPSLSMPSNSTNGSYTVSWGGVSTATSYTLQEQVNGGSWSTVQASGATSWSTSGRANGTYGYHVQACNVGGCGPWSGVSSVSVLNPPPTPTGLTATDYLVYETDVRPPQRYELDASWSAATGAASYNVQNCLQSGVCTTQTTATPSISWPATTSASASLSVQACNASGCSAWSAAITPPIVQQQ